MSISVTALRLAGALRHTLLRVGLSAGVALLVLPLTGAPAQAPVGKVSEFPFTQGGINTQGASAGRMSLGADGNLYLGRILSYNSRHVRAVRTPLVRLPATPTCLNLFLPAWTTAPSIAATPITRSRGATGS